MANMVNKEIHNRMDEIIARNSIDVAKEFDKVVAIWNDVCEVLAEEFESQGLQQSAKEALSWKETRL